MGHLTNPLGRKTNVWKLKQGSIADSLGEFQRLSAVAHFGAPFRVRTWM